MSEVTHRFNGGEPFPVSDAPPAPPPAPAAPPPAPKPNVWARVAGVFGRQREDARTKYLRLLRRVEIDGKELSNHEVEELAEAMKTAGISEADAAGHRQLIQRLRQTRASAATQPAARAAMQAAQEKFANLERQINALREQLPRARETMDSASMSFAHAGEASADAARLAADVETLFGEPVN